MTVGRKSTHANDTTPAKPSSPGLIGERGNVNLVSLALPRERRSARTEHVDRETREWINERCAREWALFEIARRTEWTPEELARGSAFVVRGTRPMVVRTAFARWRRAFGAFCRARVDVQRVVDAGEMVWPEVAAVRRRFTWVSKSFDDLHPDEQRLLAEQITFALETWRYDEHNPDSVVHVGLRRMRSNWPEDRHVRAARGDVALFGSRLRKHRGCTEGPFWQTAARRMQSVPSWKNHESGAFMTNLSGPPDPSSQDIARDVARISACITCGARRIDTAAEVNRLDDDLMRRLNDRCGPSHALASREAA